MADTSILHDGTVTRVVRHDRDAERVNVWLEGSLAFDLALELAVDAGLRPGLRLSTDEQRALVARDHLVRAREAALGYLAKGARTATEVRRSLVRRGFDADVIDEVIGYVRAHGYVDDAEYARAYVRSRFAGRGHGPARLRDELVRRGVDRGIVDAAIAELADPDDLASAATELASGRLRALGSDGDPRRRRQKTLEYLVRRGYSFDEAREAVERASAGEDQESSEGDA